MTMTPVRNVTDYPVLITPAAVAEMFRVDVKTVRTWEKKGRLRRAGNGPLRFAEHEVRALYAGSAT